MFSEVKTAHLDKFSCGKKIMELPVSYTEKLIFIPQKPRNLEARKGSLLAIKVLLPFLDVCLILVLDSQYDICFSYWFRGILVKD